MQDKGHVLRNFLLFSAAIALLTYLYKDRERLQERVNDLLDSPLTPSNDAPQEIATSKAPSPQNDRKETAATEAPEEPAKPTRTFENDIPVEEIFEPIEESIEGSAAAYLPPISRGDDFGLSAPSPTSLFRSSSNESSNEGTSPKQPEEQVDQLSAQPDELENQSEGSTEPETDSEENEESAPFEEPKEPTWVRPTDGQCPEGFPIKARFATGHFHAPGDRGYEKITPDCCYPDIESAKADGFTESRWA